MLVKSTAEEGASDGGGEAAVPGAVASKARSFRIASQSASLMYSERSRFTLLGGGPAGSLGRTSVEEPATALDCGLSPKNSDPLVLM